LRSSIVCGETLAISVALKQKLGGDHLSKRPGNSHRRIAAFCNVGEDGLDGAADLGVRFRRALPS
jgi:hypothetical protein